MSAAGRVDSLRLLGSHGSNKVMAAELARLAKRAGLLGSFEPARKMGPGALTVAFQPELARLCTVHHRTCSRVLWDLYESRAQRLEPLYDDIRSCVEAEDRGYLARDFSLSVSVRGAEHFAAGERQIVGTVKNAIIDGAQARGVRARLEPENPTYSFIVQVDADGVVVSLDLGGRPMNQRGYRVAGAIAPLRENLAAQLVMLARHDSRREMLIDPMAGTGTIAIEAACLALALPVWTAGRVPSGLALPELQPTAGSVPRSVPPPGGLFSDARPVVLANEVDPESAALIRTHGQRAQVQDYVQIRCGDFRTWSPASVLEFGQARGMSKDRGLILSNPPYGERLTGDDLRGLYNDFGVFCRSFPGFRVAVLVANPEFERAFGGRPRIKKPVSNGPLRGHFLLYDM